MASVVETFANSANSPIPHMDGYDDDTGFPFDRTRPERDRQHSFESELEDIAKRHPEFAEHLHPFQSAWPPRRSAGSPGPHSDHRSTRHRPFGSSRLEEFGFPFTSGFEEDPRFFRQYYTQDDLSGKEDSEHNPEQKDSTSKPPQGPKSSQDRSRKQASNIQQSNTVDLGQRQEPVDDQRNQRSMSAPPENRGSTGKRFVSSINIPNLNTGGGSSPSDMGSRMSAPQPEAPQASPKPNERIIPIHIEGRDEPVVPKNPNVSFGQTPPQAQPQPDRIFGQRPAAFTQFIHKTDQDEADNFQKQQQQYQKQQQENFQKQQEQPQEEEKSPPPVQKPTPLELIQNIQKDVSELIGQVENFQGKPRDKQYLYLDEMLTRNLIKLDNIETEGKDTIRQARKEGVKCIEQCIQMLENKANANEAKEKAGETVNKTQDEAEIQPETEQPKEEAPKELVVKSGSVSNTQTMEVEESAKPQEGEITQPQTESGEKKEEAKMEVNTQEAGDCNTTSQSEEVKKVKKKEDKK